MEHKQMRWILRGDFVVQSPISVHTGAAEDVRQDTRAEINDPVAFKHPPVTPAEPLPPVQAIEIDADGHPVLPATAIKGLLRGALATVVTDHSTSEKVKRLFGELPTPTSQNSQSPTGGLIEVRTARLQNPKANSPRPAIRGKTELFEGTRTADDGQLRHDRVVSPKTKFRAEFVLTRATQEDVEFLLGVLELINGENSHSALGSSTSQGDGRIKWETVEKKRFGTEEAKDWLKQDIKKTWTDCASKTEMQPKALEMQSGILLDIPLTIQIDGHFLVSALGRYQNENDETKPIRRPFRLEQNDKANAILPGASLDGALRAQAKRIFRTIAGDARPWPENDTELPPAFESLFGSSRQASLLEVDSFTAKDAPYVRQEFVAIDRFSGGQTEGKKFALEAFKEPALLGYLRLHLSRKVNAALTGKQGVTPKRALTPSALGLLALALKDLATGDVPLGHATRKGYGGVRAVNPVAGGWSDVLTTLGESVVTNAAQVDGFSELIGKTGKEALKTCVTLLQKEAENWAESRTPATAEGTA